MTPTDAGPTSVHPQELTLPTSLCPSQTNFVTELEALTDVDTYQFTEDGKLLPVGAPDTQCPQIDTDDLCQTFRHSGWAKPRRNVLCALRDAHAPQARLNRFAACGRSAYILQDQAHPDRYRIVGRYCHDRFCTPCARERSRRLTAAITLKTKHLKLRFITLTLRASRVGLAETVDRVLQGLGKLRRWQGWKSSVRGGAAFLETKYNERTESWHTHLHVLVDSDYIPQQVLKERWKMITGDSDIVDIRWAGDSRSVARYVTKYACKPLNSSFANDPELLREAVADLYNRRLVIQFGDWRGLKLTTEESPEGWKYICSLDDLLRNAARRDKTALELLSRLHSGDLATVLTEAERIHPPRAPPDPVHAPKTASLFPIW